MEKKNVLIFPAGTEIAFEIVNALKYSKFVCLYGGTSVVDHSEMVYDRLIEDFPFVTDEGFLEYLNSVIEKYSIDCIYPAHDEACVFFSVHAGEIKAPVIVADKTTTVTCRSKEATYKYFEKEDFIPKTFEKIEEVKQYPVFVKPAVGQGAVGARKVDTREELEHILNKESGLVICEYLSGIEYTVDCFTDNNGRLLVSKLRDRERIRTGISVRSASIHTDEEICRIADIINSKMRFKGAWFFQVKKNNEGEYHLMEISPRIPGTMGLSRNCGINFPMLTLFTFWGYDVSIIDNGYDIVLDRAFYSAYKINLEYEHVYIDFDDTLIINEKVNQDMMRFVYQSVNKGKKLHLLSKHSTDIYNDLARYKISERIFDEIKVLMPEEEKSDYIVGEKSIFIDDSFAERKRVHDKLGIPVFDLDMIESLIDWKV